METPISAPRKPPRPRRLRPVELDGTRLSIQAVLDVAARKRSVRIAKTALRRVQASADFLARELKRGEPIYGVTTGFGWNADRLLEDSRRRPGADDSLSLVAELQHKLIVSHAVCVGEPLPVELVRAMLLIRINTLLKGHSGVRVVTLERLRELLVLDLIPVVPSKGSVGASGDLAPLSHLALAVIGEGEVFEHGVRVPAREALARAGLEPLTLSFKEGLALNNGTGQMLASAILAIGRLEALLKQADINAALCLEAFCGRSAAFDARVHELRPHPGQIEAAANLRRLIQGSGLVDIPYHRVPRFHPWSPGAWPGQDNRTFDIRWDYIPPAERAAGSRFYERHLPFRGGKKVQPQDAYSLRCAPQVHGAIRDTLTRVRAIAEIELNSVTDNPLIFAEADVEQGEASVVSAGNFHGMPIALALTQLKCAIPVLAAIAERRLAKLVDPATNDGLPPFLIGNEDGTDSGHMIVQYTAAALVNDLASKAHPATVYSIPTSANTEDHVSMGATEGRDVLAMLDDLSRVLGLELLVATQALEFRLQILQASYALAMLGVQSLRSKLRNLSAVGPEDAPTLAADIKRLQADLRRLESAQPAPATRAALECVRRAGIAFLEHDRLLVADIERVIELVDSGAVIQAVEQALGSPLD
jgi:histidine ammonia-lyase